MQTLSQNLRYALRMLRRSPGFTAVAVLTLSLGIGANTAMFSVIRAVLLQPLPYDDPGRITMIWQLGSGREERTWLSPQEVMSYRERMTSFESFGAYTVTDANLTGQAEPERVAAAAVTANAFDVLDVDALAGRTFTPAEAVPGGDGVVLISHGLWQRRYGGDPDLIGTDIAVDGRPRTVVGIMPPSFRLPLDYWNQRATALWIPLALDRADLGGWGDRYLFGFGRLRPGTGPSAATAELGRVGRRWIEQGFIEDEGDGRFGRSAVPVGDLVVGDIRPALLLLFGGVGLVLLIACANVANLLLARSERRRKEVMIRAALGAGKGHIVSQLLTETVVLGMIGAALGLALASFGLDLLAALDPVGIPRVQQAELDLGVLAFTALLAVVSGLAFGLAPAIGLSRPQLTDALRKSGRSPTAGRTRHRFRNGLVVLELALSVVLVIGAGLLIRSFIEVRRVDPGFDPANVLTMRLSLPSSDYATAAEVTEFYRQLVEGVEAVPGVRSAAAARILPLSGTIGDWSITIEGQPRRPGENPNGDWQVVTPGYFETMGIPLVRGRGLEGAERADGPLRVVINETMAERYWPGEDALGKRFHLGTADQPWLTIVGIVGRVRHNALIEQPRAEMYVPHAHFRAETGVAPRAMTLVLKAASDPGSLTGPIREAVGGLDPSLPVAEVRTMESVVSAAFSQRRFIMLLLALFASLALALAAIGVYGVVSYTATRRTREIGIRVALGADRRAILCLVVGQGLLLTLAGIAAGVLAAIGITRLMESQIYGITTTDPATFVIVPAFLALVAAAASYLPARRAATVDPVVALRYE